MHNNFRIHSSKEFNVPEDFYSSRVNSGATDNYGYNHNELKSAKLDTLKENEMINNDQESESKISKNKAITKENKFKKILKFVLIHIGIFILVITYAVAGAFLFQLLEQHQEIQNCQLAQGKTVESVKDIGSQLKVYILYNITTNPWIDNSTSKDPPKVFNPRITSMLKDLRDNFLLYNTKYKYSGQDCEKQSLWTFSSAFLFTMTVITTIGYGHVTPTTWEGQIVCICYATVGIPLFLLGVANISSILSDMSRFIYGTMFAFLKSLFKQDQNSDDLEENSEKTENDQSERTEKIEGVVTTNKDNKMSESKKNLNDGNDDDKDEMVDQMNFGDEEYEEEEEKVGVPLFFIAIIFSSYLYGGSVIFSNIETWTDIQAAYFSFVSLATMGFGDLIPGLSSIQTGDYNKGSRNLILATIYITIGMALLAMCFELIQDQIVNKIKRISQLIGLKSNDDEDELKKKEKINKFEVVDENKNTNVNDPLQTKSSMDINPEFNIQNYDQNYIRNSSYDFNNQSSSYKTESENYLTPDTNDNNTLLVRSASMKKSKSKQNIESNC